MAEQQPLVVRLLGVVSGGPDAVVRELQGVPGRLAEQRTRIAQQVRVAHWIGEMAVSVGTREVGKRLSALRTTPSTPSADPSPTGPSPTGAGARRQTRGGDPEVARTNHPPFEGYDALPAAEIVRLLGQLPRVDLELVRAYEVSHRGRRTILLRIDQALG